ncbi:hypothetical protein MYX77_13550, partial [Acidobacteriia bacterium AH_259_A11_L15]|nr:hypothetical protein [Acidobacteriia bacterium AH_259_A11_L15]
PLSLFFSTYLPDRSPSNLEQFERAVSYIASLGHYYRAKGHEFRFSSGEFEVTVNGHKQDYEALMEYLAGVQPTDQVRLDERQMTGPCILFAAGDSVGLEAI